MNDELYKQGMKTRRSVLGDKHVNNAEANKSHFDADFQRFITETAWGTVWSRPGLDLRTRNLLTIAILAALGKEHELDLHLHATKNVGVIDDEVKEVLMQVAVYAGIPAANTAFKIAKRVFAELDEEKTSYE